MSWDQTMILLKAIQENGISSANGTIMMVPFSENKYGFNIKLTDIDGTTPLKDVTLTGVSNPTTELRTNSDGRVKFISDSPKHNISFSNFPKGYAYGDLFVQQPVQGYINDMTEIVITPDKSQFAGYTITFTYNGSTLAGKTINCSTNGKSYITDSSGKINNVYAKNTTMQFNSTISGKFASGDYVYGSASVSGSCTGSIGSVVSRNIAMGSPTIQGNPIGLNKSVPSVGSELTIGSYTYIVCHVDSNTVYAITKNLQGSTVFGNNTTYAGSTLAQKCTDWYNNNVPSNWKTYNFFRSVSVNGVNSACFVPSYEQFNGGFSYFYSNERRACDGSWYWTSSAYSPGTLWYVSRDGNLNLYEYNPSDMRGFRPCLAIARSAFAS